MWRKIVSGVRRITLFGGLILLFIALSGFLGTYWGELNLALTSLALLIAITIGGTILIDLVIHAYWQRKRILTKTTSVLASLPSLALRGLKHVASLAAKASRKVSPTMPTWRALRRISLAMGAILLAAVLPGVIIREIFGDGNIAFWVSIITGIASAIGASVLVYRRYRQWRRNLTPVAATPLAAVTPPSTTPLDGNLNEINLRGDIYRRIVWAYYTTHLALLVIGFTQTFTFWEQEVPFWVILLPIQIGHLYAAWVRKKVDVHEVGGQKFLGWALNDRLEPGPVFDPPGLGLTLLAKPIGMNQDQMPAEPELVFKGTDDQYDALSDAQKKLYKKPIRILSGEGEGDHEFESQMVLEFTGIIQFVIFAVIPWEARFGHDRNHLEAVKEAFRLLRDTFESVLVQQVSTHSPRWVNQHLTAIRELIKAAMLEQIKGWGIEVIKVELMSPDLGVTVSQALRSIPAAKLALKEAGPKAEALAIATERAGLATANVTVLQGNADASKVKALLKAQGQGLKAKAKSLGVEPRDVLAAEVAESLGDNVILGAEGIAQLWGAGKAIANQINKPAGGAP